MAPSTLPLKRPRPPPFPLCLDYAEYFTSIMVASDDDSDLARQFRYLTRPDIMDLYDREVFDDHGFVNLLEIAAKIGDLEFLDALKLLFGGIVYQQSVAEAALYSNHLDWFMLFVELSKSTCVLVPDADTPQPEWARPRIQLLTDAMVHPNIILYLYEHAIKTYPPAIELQALCTTQTEPGRFAPISDAAALISSYEGYPDLILAERDTLLEQILVDDEFLDPRFLRTCVDAIGLRFNEEQVRVASLQIRRCLYDFVLSNLEDGLDAVHLREMYPLKVPDDSELFRMISRDFHELYRTNRILDGQLAELLRHRPELTPNIVRLAHLLKSPTGPDVDQSLLRKVANELASFANCTSNDPMLATEHMAKFAHEVLRRSSH